MAGKPAKKIDPPKQTTEAVFSGPAFGGAECFTPNWDKEVSGGQGMKRAAVRARMSKKMTPLGRGTLIKGD